MSRALERLGRFAARRPWFVIGSWAAVCLLVVTSAAAFGRELDDPFEAPGLDSHRATELLAKAGSGDDGARRGHRPHAARPGATFFDSPGRGPRSRGSRTPSRRCRRYSPPSDPAGALQRSAGAVESGVVSPDGQVALIRVQYPERKDLAAADLENLKALLDDLRETSSLRIEAGGDLYFAFEQAPTGVGEALGLLAAIVILLLAFGSAGRDGPADRNGAARPRGRRRLPVPGRVRRRHPGLGGGDRVDGRPGRRHRLRPVRADPVPGAPGRGLRRRGRRRPLPRHRRTLGRLRRRHGGRGDPRPGRRQDPVRHRRWNRDLRGRAGDGARLDHLAARAAGLAGTPGQRAPVPAATRPPDAAGAGGARTSAATPRRTPSAPPSCCSPSRRR